MFCLLTPSSTTGGGDDHMVLPAHEEEQPVMCFNAPQYVSMHIAAGENTVYYYQTVVYFQI